MLHMTMLYMTVVYDCVVLYCLWLCRLCISHVLDCCWYDYDYCAVYDCVVHNCVVYDCVVWLCCIVLCMIVSFMYYSCSKQRFKDWTGGKLQKLLRYLLTLKSLLLYYSLYILSRVIHTVDKLHTVCRPGSHPEPKVIYSECKKNFNLLHYVPGYT